MTNRKIVEIIKQALEERRLQGFHRLQSVGWSKSTSNPGQRSPGAARYLMPEMTGRSRVRMPSTASTPMFALVLLTACDDVVAKRCLRAGARLRPETILSRRPDFCA